MFEGVSAFIFETYYTLVDKACDSIVFPETKEKEKANFSFLLT